MTRLPPGWIHAAAARRAGRRRWVSVLACAALAACGVAALVPLLSVLTYVIQRGAPAVNWAFFTQLPQPVGEPGGGMLNALVGTLIVVAEGAAIGVPFGVATGVYLSEYGAGRVGTVVRFAVDLLNGIPSIILGLFAYTLVVVPMKGFSALAGGIALGVLMIPTIARSTEAILHLVPTHLREAGLGLGLPRWKVTIFLVLRGSLPGIATGVILAVARAAGETAPLLFTALNNRLLSFGLTEPIATLPVQIYTYAISPFEDWQRQAWAGALLLVMTVLCLNLATRLAFVVGAVRRGRR